MAAVAVAAAGRRGARTRTRIVRTAEHIELGASPVWQWSAMQVFHDVACQILGVQVIWCCHPPTLLSSMIVAYILNIGILGPVAPLTGQYSVCDSTDLWLALWEVTYVLCIRSFFFRLYFGGYSIFMIARSIDPAPLPSEYISSMGPGLAVVGTSGSPLDVARTTVLLPRLLGDSVRCIVRLRSVAT